MYYNLPVLHIKYSDDIVQVHLMNLNYQSNVKIEI